MLRSLARLRSPARSLGQHRLLGAGSRCQICTQTPASAKKLDHIATEKRAAARSEADEASLHFLQERASALGLRLSLEERKLIVADADGDGDGKMSPEEWRHLVNQHAIGAHERSLIGQYILKTIDQYQGQHLLRWTARMGVCFFAVCGANVAGEAGMHVFGATVVGCVTGVTGSTFNAVLLSSPVAWVRDPGLLAAMIAVSLAGFCAPARLDRRPLGLSAPLLRLCCAPPCPVPAIDPDLGGWIGPRLRTDLWPLADRWMPAQSKECATVSGGQPSSGAQPESVVRYALVRPLVSIHRHLWVRPCPVLCRPLTNPELGGSRPTSAGVRRAWFGRRGRGSAGDCRGLASTHIGMPRDHHRLWRGRARRPLPTRRAPVVRVGQSVVRGLRFCRRLRLRCPVSAWDCGSNRQAAPSLTFWDMHTHMHTCAHAHVHTCTHTSIRTYAYRRELHVWNCSGSSARLLSGGIPIGLRIVLSIGTSCAVRWIAWQQKPHDLFWSMETAADRNAAALRSLWGPSDSAAAGKGDPKS